MIRYYGIYARHRDSDKHIVKAIPEHRKRFVLSMNKWRLSIGFTFGYDPLQCPCCDNTMSLLELFHNHKRVPLDDLFRKAIEKYQRNHTCDYSLFYPYMLH